MAALALIASPATSAHAEAPQMRERFVIVSGDGETDKVLGTDTGFEALFEGSSARVERTRVGGDWLIDLGESWRAGATNLLEIRLPEALVASTDDPAALLAPVDEATLDASEQNELRAFRDAVGDPNAVPARAPPARYGRQLLNLGQEERGGFAIVDPTGGSSRFFTQRVAPHVRGFQVQSLGGRGGEELSVVADEPKSGESMEISGFLYTAAGTYRVVSLNDRGLHALYRLEDTDERLDHFATPSGEETAPDPDFHPQCRSADTLIEIAWVAEDRAFRRLTTDRTFLPDTMASLDATMKVHNISGYSFRLDPALATPFVHTATTAETLARDLGVFPSSLRFPALHQALRDMHADLVVAFVSYAGGVDGTSCGATPTPANQRWRLFVVDVNCMTDKRFTFQHELGHIFGAEHDELCYGVRNGAPDYRYDWRAADGLTGTLVAEWRCRRATALTRRFPHYSDPNILSEPSSRGAPRIPHGDPATNNVRQLISERIQAVAGYSTCR